MHRPLSDIWRLSAMVITPLLCFFLSRKKAPLVSRVKDRIKIESRVDKEERMCYIGGRFPTERSCRLTRWSAIAWDDEATGSVRQWHDGAWYVRKAPKRLIMSLSRNDKRCGFGCPTSSGFAL